LAANASKAGVAEMRTARYPLGVMRSFGLICFVLAALLQPATAADGVGVNGVPPVIGPHPPVWHFNGPPQDPPFSRARRAQAVWDGGACWSECGSYCAWNLTRCLYDDTTQGSCVVNTDSCDLICQRACRTQGGPFLPID
jgi:hypothetical protein